MVVDLIMGLDIGSSTTKVVIRQAWAGDDNFYVVDFKLIVNDPTNVRYNGRYGGLVGENNNTIIQNTVCMVYS